MEMQFRAVSPPPTYGTGSVQTAPKPTQTVQSSATERQSEPLERGIEAKQIHPKEITEKFNQLSNEMNLDVKFAYNEKINQFYINVIDKNSGKVIRKLPSDEAMKIAESMKELIGTLFDKRG